MSEHLAHSASVLEAIAYLQRQAYIAAGIHPAGLSAHFAGLKRKMEDFQQQNPGYLPSQDEILSADPDLDFVELDFGRRFEVDVPTPFQNPWSFAILSDYWEYHRRKLYRNDTWSLVLATAPTRKYNAQAIAGDNQFGILIEDGLMYLARLVCAEVAPLLYARAGSGFRVHSDAGLAAALKSTEHANSIALAILRYVSHQPIIPPAPVVDRNEDFSIRHVLFSGFMAFVLEHELYHLRKAKLGDDDSGFQELFEPVWILFDTKLRGRLPSIPERHELEELLRKHREEIWADTLAVSRVMLLGKLDDTVSSSLCGALLFHFTIEIIRTAVLLKEDPDLLTSEADASEEALAAQSLYLRETHPYPQSRLASLRWLLYKLIPNYRQVLDDEIGRLSAVFKEVRSHLILTVGS